MNRTTFTSLNDHLIHYGVKGQKWGIRRYQNPDGTLTEEGKKWYASDKRDYRRMKRYENTQDKIDKITKTFSKQDWRFFVGPDADNPRALEYNYEYGGWTSLAKRVIKTNGDTPVAFLDLAIKPWDDALNIIIGTHSDYRGKGYAKKAVEEGLKWVERNKDHIPLSKLMWSVYKGNDASIKLAEENGFKFVRSYQQDGNLTDLIYEKAIK